MSGSATPVPDDAQLAVWLEQRLLGLDFPDLVASLSAGRPASGPSAGGARQALGPWRDEVRERGLRGLPGSLLRSEFVEQAQRLHDLQEFVLTEGGPYWSDLAGALADEPGALHDAVVRGRQRLDRQLAPRRRGTLWGGRPVLLAVVSAVLSAAATLLVCGLLGTWRDGGTAPPQPRPAGPQIARPSLPPDESPELGGGNPEDEALPPWEPRLAGGDGQPEEAETVPTKDPLPG